MDDERIVVVQGGGGLTGANIGLWDELFRRGKRPKKVHGVSVGALNCAMIAQDGPSALEQHWREVGRGKPSDIFSWKGIPWHVLKWDPSLLSDAGLDALMRKIDCKKIIESDIELEVVVNSEAHKRMEIISSREKRFQDNPELLRLFIKASASLTGYFPPVNIEGQNYSDGYYFHLEHLEDFDTIFIMQNDDPAFSPKVEPAYKRLRVGARQVLDDMEELQILYFLERHKEFQKQAHVDSGLGFFRGLPGKIKKLFGDVGAKVEEVLTGTPPKIPKRLFLVSPNYSIPTLKMDYFCPGDIEKAIELSKKQARELLEWVYPIQK